MVPVEDKSPPHNLKLELNLNQATNQNGNVAATTSLSPTAKILNFERQQHFSSSSTDKPKTEQAQRPKTLIKPNQLEMDLTDNTGKEAGGSSSGGSILATSSIGGSSDDGPKKIKMTKIGNTKNAALKR